MNRHLNNEGKKCRVSYVKGIVLAGIGRVNEEGKNR
jgi:hypothetical protein